MAQASSPHQPCPTSAANPPDDNDDDERRRIGAEFNNRRPDSEQRDSAAQPRPPVLAASTADHDQPRHWPASVVTSSYSSPSVSAPPYIAAPILVADPDASAIQPTGLTGRLSSTPSFRASSRFQPSFSSSASTAGPAPLSSRYTQPDYGLRASPSIPPAGAPLSSPADPRVYSPAGASLADQQRQHQQLRSVSPAPLPPPKLPPLSSLSPNPAGKDGAEDAPGLLLPYQAALGASSGQRSRELSADYAQSQSPIPPPLLSSSTTTITAATSIPGAPSAPIAPSPSSAPLQASSAMASHGHNTHGPPRLPSTNSFAYATGPPSSYPPPTPSQPPAYSYSSAGVVPPGGSGSLGSSLGGGASTSGGMSDLYRQPPSAGPTPMSQPLPSMRTIDPLQLPPPPSTSGMQLGPPPPPPQQQQSLPPSGMGYYSMPPPYGLPPPQFGLPGHLGHFPDIRMPSMGMSNIPRHKKEIKRRTKTGCMTCRKRRIKCDETHPTCNNCKKSKRECAGYDPIFKPQTQSASLVQNQSSVPGSFSATATNAGAGSGIGSNRAPSIPITPTAAAAVAAAAAAAASTASTLAAIKSPSSVAAPPPMSTTSRSPVAGMYSTTTHPSEPAGNAPYNTAVAYAPGPYSQRSILAPLDDHLALPDPSGQVYKSKMKVDEIIKLSGAAPPPLTDTPSRDMLDDLVKYYYDVYVPGLTTFFETTWYKFKSSGITNPISILLNNRTLIGLLAAYAGGKSFAIPQIGGLPATQSASPSLEMNLVWSLACMAYVTPTSVNLPRPEPLAVDDAAEARNRLTAVDALLSGGCLRTNPCLPPPDSGDRHRIREHQFWWWLAEYLRLQHDADWNGTPGNSMTRLREQALEEMARLQDGRENREVIYAIAVLRDLVPRFPPGYLGRDGISAQNIQYVIGDDPRIRLATATACIYKAGSEYGSNFSVARRMAQLGIKAFVDPGYSIRRL